MNSRRRDQLYTFFSDSLGPRNVGIRFGSSEQCWNAVVVQVVQHARGVPTAGLVAQEHGCAVC
jgi:hypothetical protein